MTRISHLAHASHRNAAEGSEHVGLDTRRRLKHKDATGTKQINWHLAGKHSTVTLKRTSLNYITVVFIIKIVLEERSTLGLISIVKKSLKLA